MGVQLIKTKMRKMFSNTTTASTRSTTLRIVAALIAMALLLWTVGYGYQAATEPRRHPLPLYGQWISRVGALIVLFAFLLLALGLPIIADLVLRLSAGVQYPDATDIHQSSNLKVKVDASV